jgi:TRAP-type C4-dicarboxylate transport system permease small subunit
MRYAAEILFWLTRGLRFVGQLVLAFMVITICYDALMRYVFARPTEWSLEVNTFLLVYIAVMTAADVQRTREHISIGFMVEKSSAAVQRVLGGVVALVGVVFCTILAWRGWLMAEQAYLYGERVSSALGTPMVLPYSMLPIGFGVMALVFLVQLIQSIVGDGTVLEQEGSHG